MQPTYLLRQWQTKHNKHLSKTGGTEGTWAWIIQHSLIAVLGSWAWLLAEPLSPSGLCFWRRLIGLLHTMIAGFQEDKRENHKVSWGLRFKATYYHFCHTLLVNASHRVNLNLRKWKYFRGSLQPSLQIIDQRKLLAISARVSCLQMKWKFKGFTLGIPSN